MSLHSSLRVDKAGAAARTVLTRVERIKELMKKGQFTAASSVVNLPKTKVVRVKAGKKKVKEAGAAGAAGAAPAGAAPAAGAKAPAAKSPAKK
ncbi:MAG: small basic protein [Candidatus Omnitrophica bacterium]|nr:small basic protein [Candidatus Omnitrophota bacterium]